MGDEDAEFINEGRYWRNSFAPNDGYFPDSSKMAGKDRKVLRNYQSDILRIIYIEIFLWNFFIKNSETQLITRHFLILFLYLDKE